MKRIPLYILSVLLVQGLSSCAQSSKVIKSATSYRAVRIAGNVPVDDEGKEIRPLRDTLIFLYVETGKEEISWTKVDYNGKAFAVTPLQVTGSPVLVGRDSNGKEIRIPVKKNNQLWKLELSVMDDPSALPAKQRGMVMYGTVGGRDFKYDVASPVFIKLPDSY